jgi:hypothetical protein
MNLTPIEKAKELVDKFKTYSNSYWIGPIVNRGPHYSEEEKIINAKKIALIAVDEILHLIKDIYCYDFDILNPYYQEVKIEIEKL